MLWLLRRYRVVIEQSNSVTHPFCSRIERFELCNVAHFIASPMISVGAVGMSRLLMKILEKNRIETGNRSQRRTVSLRFYSSVNLLVRHRLFE